MLSFIGKMGYENGIGVMSAEERMAAGKKGYKNGLGAMLAEEARMAASEKGYENGLRAMSAEERMAASEKGSSNDKIGIACEKKYAEFKRCVERPERGNPYILGKRISWAMDVLV